MNRAQKTADLQLNGGLNCAQAILTVFGEQFDLTPASARVLGRPWGGGMAQCGKTCGYLTGAMLVLAYAYKGGDEETARKELGNAVRALFRRFEALRGTTLCKDLLGADMSTPEGARKIRAEMRVKATCCAPGGIGETVGEILEALIASRPRDASTPDTT